MTKVKGDGTLAPPPLWTNAGAAICGGRYPGARDPLVLTQGFSVPSAPSAVPKSAVPRTLRTWS
jgi:hypothetical protein